ncbi:hypothetical protein N7449_002530 [Penicillium cf. viridicatum]|uniref:Uncharacterized protein n=1 Tax=Penicillium cf. viridicatum TaxID=2972119 RepID=A0A9W9MV99_9EURO|nr:hypothetical protein N7449_002530 [Penicillium cf. viridicatum]
MSSPDSSRAGSTASAPPIDDNGLSRMYIITNRLFRRHYDINSADDQPLFYAEISMFTPNKPDLILHAGIGNPEDVINVQWEDMTRELLHKPKYRFEMTVQCASDRTQSERRSFLWKRTRTIGVENAAPSKWTGRNYKLVDERTEQVLAVFSGARRPGRVGKLQIRVEYGEDFDRMVLVSCLTLCEKARRRKQRSSGGGGG